MKNDKSYKIKKLKKQITDHLKSTDLYEKIDDMLIDKLVFNVILCDDAQADILERGMVVNVAKPENNPYYMTNPSVNVFFSATKMISALCTKMGINATERRKLKIDMSDDTTLDDLLN